MKYEVFLGPKTLISYKNAYQDNGDKLNDFERGSNEEYEPEQIEPISSDED